MKGVGQPLNGGHKRCIRLYKAFMGSYRDYVGI